MKIKTIATGICLLFVLITWPLMGNTESGGNDFGFGMAMEIGAQTFNENGEQVAYQQLVLYPDFEIGNFGIGLAIALNYRFDPDFTIREKDWVPDKEAGRGFFDLYLPLFRYVRYGHRGDPIHAKFGSITDGTLGNGFIMGNYANTLLLPERRILGLAFDLDGAFFNFPYLGIETFIGNIAQFDVLGARLFARPLYGMDLGLLKSLQIGTTIAADRNPAALHPGSFTDAGIDPDTLDAVTIFGIDFRQPILTDNPVTLSLFGDLAFQPGGGTTNPGFMLGFGGRMIGFINYGLHTLILGENFVPFYFDNPYDLLRKQKYLIYSGEAGVEPYAGWLARLGFNLLNDALIFNTSLGGAFSREDGQESTYPYLQAQLIFTEGLIPGVFFDASYDKRYIETLDDLLSPEDAVIQANINYRTGPAVVTLGYNVRYNPNYDPADEDDEKWEITAKLSTTISF